MQRTEQPHRSAGNRGRALAGGRPGRHPDYGLLQDENTKRGAAGEQLVVEYERTWLREHVRSDLADRVRWTTRDDGDGLGYDVLSYSADGSKGYIEVKTTALGDLPPFYLSSAELAFARQHIQSYALYRVYDVLASQPCSFALGGEEILQLDLTPVTYRACFPAQSPRRTRQAANGLDGAATGASTMRMYQTGPSAAPAVASCLTCCDHHKGPEMCRSSDTRVIISAYLFRKLSDDHPCI